MPWMRRLPLPTALTIALAAAVTPAVVVLPTVARPTPGAHEVAPRVAAVPLRGVDAAALATLTRTEAAAGRTAAAALAPALRKALAGDLAANPLPPTGP